MEEAGNFIFRVLEEEDINHSEPNELFLLLWVRSQQLTIQKESQKSSDDELLHTYI